MEQLFYSFAAVTVNAAYRTNHITCITYYVTLRYVHLVTAAVQHIDLQESSYQYV